MKPKKIKIPNLTLPLILSLCSLYPLYPQPPQATKSSPQKIYSPYHSLIQKLQLSIVAISPIPLTKKQLQKETFRQRWYRLQREAMMHKKVGKFSTGVLLNPYGHILTLSATLPKNAKKVLVTFLNGKTFHAKILKKYPQLAVAILKLPQPYGKPIPLYNSQLAQLGQPIATLGNSHNSIVRDAQLCISQGHITGKYPIHNTYYQGTVLEIDAAVNFGDFGAPVVNLNGEMIAICLPSISKIRWLPLAVPVHTILPKLQIPLPKPLSYLPPPSPHQSIPKQIQKYVACLQYQLPPKQTLLPKDPYQYRIKPICSGVHWGKGYILTSLHSVKNAKKFWLLTPDGKRIPIQILGKNENLDLLLLFTPEYQHLPPPPLANTKQSKVGQQTVIVAKPLSPNSYTLNWGILSATHRAKGKFFQTDSRLNLGNEGGAVANQSGQILGVAVRPYPITGNNSGVGFFVPVHNIQATLPLLKQGKTIPKQYPATLEIQLQPIQPRITYIPPTSPAYNKLQIHDLILKINHTPIQNTHDYHRTLEKISPEQPIQLTIQRNQQTLSVTLTPKKQKQPNP